MRMQNSTMAMEKSMKFSEKVKSINTILLTNPTSGHLFKRIETRISKRH